MFASLGMADYVMIIGGLSAVLVMILMGGFGAKSTAPPDVKPAAQEAPPPLAGLDTWAGVIILLAGFAVLIVGWLIFWLLTH